MSFRKARDFIAFINHEAIRIDGEDQIEAVVAKPEVFRSSISIRSERDHQRRITVEFSVKFSHIEYPEEGVFQREFSLEHHPEDKSTHTKPHLQIYMHGPAPENKVGELWITLELENDGEYDRCIKGFICVLEDVMYSCRDDLDLLDIESVEGIKKEKAFFIGKVLESVQKQGIEYKPSHEEKYVLTYEDISRLRVKDPTFIPLFDSL